MKITSSKLKKTVIMGGALMAVTMLCPELALAGVCPNGKPGDPTAIAGNACNVPGTTTMTCTNHDIVACLVNPAGGSPTYKWWLTGTNVKNGNGIPKCDTSAGLILHYDDLSGFHCDLSGPIYPTCSANQGLTYDGTTFFCQDIVLTAPPAGPTPTPPIDPGPGGPPYDPGDPYHTVGTYTCSVPPVIDPQTGWPTCPAGN